MPNYTWDKRLGKKNTKKVAAKEGPFEGVVFEWMTKDGIPVCFPDQWDEDNGDGKMPGLVRLPDTIPEVHYMGKVDTEE